MKINTHITAPTIFLYGLWLLCHIQKPFCLLGEKELPPLQILQVSLYFHLLYTICNLL